jgi:NTP pyrophosphatase (non-canonical NTP hydrolase)
MVNWNQGDAGMMNLTRLQADLRHFAAERDWQPFQTPKNLSTALMVEAAELAEIFQWMTTEESRLAHQDAGSKQRIGEEVADVLIYLLQVADHCEIDIAPAVRDKLARNALKYPAKRELARVLPPPAELPGTCVLLDYENVQPTEDELRAMVPDASLVWVFHGPHQQQVEQRFGSFGANVKAVPISKTGKNALDFHLSFYVGLLASRNPAPSIVVVANDKGYGAMLEHAKSSGFNVRQQGHGQAKPIAPVKATAAANPAARKVAAKKAPSKKTPAKKVPVKKAVAKQSTSKQVTAKKAASKKAAATAAKKAPAKKGVPVKKALAKPANPPTAQKPAIGTPHGRAKEPASSGTGAQAPVLSPHSASTIEKLINSLRKMGAARPTKPASLRQSLKSNLGPSATEDAITAALDRLIKDGVVKLDPVKGASYPKF